MENHYTNEDLKREIQSLRLRAELNKERHDLKRQLRHINNPHLYDSWNGVKKDTSTFFSWFGKFITDINKPERRYYDNMETTTAQDFVDGDEREEFDNGCDIFMPEDPIGIPRTPFTDF